MGVKPSHYTIPAWASCGRQSPSASPFEQFSQKPIHHIGPPKAKPSQAIRIYSQSINHLSATGQQLESLNHIALSATKQGKPLQSVALLRWLWIHASKLMTHVLQPRCSPHCIQQRIIFCILIHTCMFIKHVLQPRCSSHCIQEAYTCHDPWSKLGLYISL